MTDSTIELHLDVPHQHWMEALISQNNTQRSLPDFWWQSLASSGGELFQHLFEISHDKQQPTIEEWREERARLHLILSAGAEGGDIAQALVILLSRVGCRNVQAIFYHDECDVIMDDGGEMHQIGTRYYLDNMGQLAKEDYPEVEYEYYE